MSADGKVWALQMNSVPVIDQPQWPARDARALAATMDFKLVWTVTDEKIVYEDASKHFRVEGFRALAQLEAKVSVPALGFSWKSDPLETSHCDFALVGDEVNGRYFDPPPPPKK